MYCFIPEHLQDVVIGFAVLKKKEAFSLYARLDLEDKTPHFPQPKSLEINNNYNNTGDFYSA